MVVRDGKLVKQSDIVREAVKAGEWKKALRIAKDFRINVTKEQRDTMARAYECMVHPEFYRQIGTDIPGAIAKGKEVVAFLYSTQKEKTHCGSSQVNVLQMVYDPEKSYYPDDFFDVSGNGIKVMPEKDIIKSLEGAEKNTNFSVSNAGLDVYKSGKNEWTDEKRDFYYTNKEMAKLIATESKLFEANRVYEEVSKEEGNKMYDEVMGELRSLVKR